METWIMINVLKLISYIHIHIKSRWTHLYRLNDMRITSLIDKMIYAIAIIIAY